MAINNDLVKESKEIQLHQKIKVTTPTLRDRVIMEGEVIEIKKLTNGVSYYKTLFWNQYQNSHYNPIWVCDGLVLKNSSHKEAI